jgi:hypothetical protein
MLCPIAVLSHWRQAYPTRTLFLLDRQTGELWLMTCRADKSVEFRRVRKLKLYGTPELEEAASPVKTAGKNAVTESATNYRSEAQLNTKY